MELTPNVSSGFFLSVKFYTSLMALLAGEKEGRIRLLQCSLLDDD